MRDDCYNNVFIMCSFKKKWKNGGENDETKRLNENDGQWWKKIIVDNGVVDEDDREVKNS